MLIIISNVLYYTICIFCTIHEYIPYAYEMYHTHIAICIYGMTILNFSVSTYIAIANCISYV